MRKLLSLLTIVCLSVYCIGCGESSTTPSGNGSTTPALGNGSSDVDEEIPGDPGTPDEAAVSEAAEQPEADAGENPEEAEKPEADGTPRRANLSV